MKKIIAFFLIILVMGFSSPTGGRYPTYAKKGMVVSASMVASEIGRDILKQGGNAMDAAVATAFALAVTWPSAGNIGGGGFILSVDKNGNATSFDFREKAPLAANEKMYLDENGKQVPGLNSVGSLSVGVPGTVAGLFLAHQRYGKLQWKKLVDPSVALAAKGIMFTQALYEQSKSYKPTFDKYPSTKKIMYKPDGSFYEPGELWKQPELAKTLKLISSKGRDGFYKGVVAEKFEAFMKATGGIITQEDLANYEAVERKPVKGTYRGHEVYSMAPPSSGGVALIEMLNILEGYDLNELGYKSSNYIHVVTEAMRRAFADRAEVMGDPDFNPDIPLAKIMSKEYADRIRKTIDLQKASVSDSSKFGQIYDGGANTTHLSVVDAEGNAVSLTYTLQESYGSKVIAEGLGFFLNNEMSDFNVVPGVTTRGSQIGTKPNLIAPGKRMLSSMTPTILRKDGKTVLVTGTPGGRTIPTSILQVVLNFVDHKMNIAQAVEASRFHHQWLPDRIYFEHYSFPADIQKSLREKGHTLFEVPLTGLAFPGHAMSIAIDENGLRAGAADSRGADGGVAGY